MTEHHAALAWGDVPDMLERVRASNATDAVKGAIEMVALPAARSGEVRGMMWREVDWDASMWTVPAPRTKGGKADFRVALSMQAKDLLHRFTREYKPDDLVFSGSRDGCSMTARCPTGSETSASPARFTAYVRRSATGAPRRRTHLSRSARRHSAIASAGRQCGHMLGLTSSNCEGRSCSNGRT